MIAVLAVVVSVSALSCKSSCYAPAAVLATGTDCSCHQGRNSVPVLLAHEPDANAIWVHLADLPRKAASILSLRSLRTT